ELRGGGVAPELPAPPPVVSPARDGVEAGEVADELDLRPVGERVHGRDEGRAGVLVALEVVPLGEEVERRLEVRPDRMPEVELEGRRQMLELLGGDLFTAAVADVAEGKGDREEIGAEVEAASGERGVGVIARDESAGEEDGDLFALAPEVEVEMLDAEQRQRVIERVVVEGAEQPEGALLGDLLLDDAFVGARRVRHEVPHSSLGVPDHL